MNQMNDRSSGSFFYFVQAIVFSQHHRVSISYRGSELGMDRFNFWKKDLFTNDEEKIKYQG